MCIGDGDTGGQGVSWGSSPRNDRHEDGICYQGNTVQHQDKLLMQLHVVFVAFVVLELIGFFYHAVFGIQIRSGSRLYESVQNII